MLLPNYISLSGLKKRICNVLFSLIILDTSLTQCHAVLQPMIEIVENIHYSHSWHLFKNRIGSVLNIHGKLIVRFFFVRWNSLHILHNFGSSQSFPQIKRVKFLFHQYIWPSEVAQPPTESKQQVINYCFGLDSLIWSNKTRFHACELLPKLEKNIKHDCFNQILDCIT